MTLRRKTYRTVRLSLVRETAATGYIQPRQIKGGPDVADLLRAFIGDDPREHFVAVYLDAKHRVVAVHTISIGTVDQSPVSPREVYGPAMQLGAAAIVVAHNHPSGDPTPSINDRTVTGRLREVAELIGVAFLDHVILGDACFWSFADDRKHPAPLVMEQY